MDIVVAYVFEMLFTEIRMTCVIRYLVNVRDADNVVDSKSKPYMFDRHRAANVPATLDFF